MSTKRDYYEVLGIGKNADQAEIKQQYRKMALKFHPDRNKSSEAVEHFKEISEAYAVLSDSEKRSLYDQHGHAGVDGKYSSEDIFRGARGNFGDVFGDMFRGSGGFGNIFDIFVLFLLDRRFWAKNLIIIPFGRHYISHIIRQCHLNSLRNSDLHRMILFFLRCFL